MKKLLSILLCAAMLSSALTALVSSEVPSDVWTESENVKLAAPAEDETLELWFDHTSKKQEQTDLTSTGLHTYTMTMAKNVAKTLNRRVWKNPLCFGSTVFSTFLFISCSFLLSIVDAECYAAQS